MFIRYFEEVPLRHEAAEQAFTHQPEALLRRLAGEADHNGEQLEVEVGFSAPGARVRRSVELIVGEPVQVSGRLLVPIEWKPLHGHHLFPSLQGDLEVGGLGPQRTQIALSARYQPPLGLLGSAADRALLHRVAEATVRDFVQRLAHAILIEAGTAEGLGSQLIDSPLDS
jgi:hypothetical protein